MQLKLRDFSRSELIRTGSLIPELFVPFLYSTQPGKCVIGHLGIAAIGPDNILYPLEP